MRICLLTPEYYPTIGGVAQSVRRIARGLSKENCIVDILITQPEMNSPYYKKDNLVNVYRPIEQNMQSSRETWQKICLGWLTTHVTQQKIDLVHAFYISRTSFIAGSVAKAHGLPFVASGRGSDLLASPGKPKHFEFVKWTIENADFLTFTSEEMSLMTHNTFMITCPTKVIWNSIDPDEFSQDQDGVPDYIKRLDYPVIGYIGNIKRVKGIERLISSLALLKRSVSVLLIGQIYSYETEYWAEILKQIPPNIKLIVTGSVEHKNVLSYCRLTNIIVLPSLTEGCPNSLLEAMIASKPVVCTDVGAMGDIIRESKGGVVIDQFSDQRLAQTIDSLIDNISLCNEYGQNNYFYAKSHLNPQREINDWLSTYKELLR